MKASSVIQNGPAFFDRTSSASSPSVAGASPGSAIRYLQTEQVGRRVGVDDVVEHELVRRAAVDVGGGGGEREAGQVTHRRQRQVQQQRVGQLGNRRRRLLVFRADQQHHSYLARCGGFGLQLAEDGVVAVQPQVASP